MKKLMTCLLLAIDTYAFPQFNDYFFEEFVQDEVSEVYHYCKYMKTQANKNMNETNKTYLRCIYRTEMDTYNDVMEYILK